MSFRRPPDSCFRDVRCQTVGIGVGLENLGQMVTGSSSYFHNAISADENLGQPSIKVTEQPGVQHPLAGSDHLDGVRISTGRGACHGDVALLGDIETVVLGASQRPPITGQRVFTAAPLTGGTDQPRQDYGKCRRHVWAPGVFAPRLCDASWRFGSGPLTAR